jgi:hypothetical protein
MISSFEYLNLATSIFGIQLFLEKLFDFERAAVILKFQKMENSNSKSSFYVLYWLVSFFWVISKPFFILLCAKKCNFLGKLG